MKNIELEEQIKKAEEEYTASIKNMQAIYKEELTRREKEGPFKTEEELDNFNNYYMNLKQKQNELYLQSKKNLDILKKRQQIATKKSSPKQKPISSKQNIVFKPQNSKLLLEKKKESSLSDFNKDERIVSENDLKTLVLTRTNKKKTNDKHEEDAIAKKVDLTKSKPSETRDIKVDKEEKTRNKKKNLIELVEEIFHRDIKLSNKPTASHVEASSKFKEEMKSDKYLYNIIKKVPGLVKTPFRLFKKLSDRIIRSVSGRKKIEKVKATILTYSPDELNKLNKILDDKQDQFPTVAKVMIGDAVNKKTSETGKKIDPEKTIIISKNTKLEENKLLEKKEIDVNIPKVTVSSLQEQINAEFRRMGLSEEEIDLMNANAKANAEASMRRIEESQYETTPEELLEKIDKSLNRLSQNPAIKGVKK